MCGRTVGAPVAIESVTVAASSADTIVIVFDTQEAMWRATLGPEIAAVGDRDAAHV